MYACLKYTFGLNNINWLSILKKGLGFYKIMYLFGGKKFMLEIHIWVI